MKQSRWRYGTAALTLLLLLGVMGCAVERGKIYVKDGKQYGVVSGIWRNKWWQHYERGVSYAAGGFWDEAITSFEAALTARPGQKDRLRANTYGVHFIEGYFPHRELGIVYYHLRRYTQAQLQLERSLRTVDTAKGKFYLNKTRKALLQQTNIDTAPPRIVLDSPADGLLINDFTVEVKGRVEDDTFVATLAINGRSVFVELAEPRLSFTKKIALHDGPNAIDIVAADLLGRQTRQRLTVHLDRHGPLVSLEQVEILGVSPHRQARVQGFLSDRSPITRFVLAGREVRLPATTESAFREVRPVVPGGTSLPFEAEDAAGNITHGEIALTLPAPGTPGTRQGLSVPPGLPRWASLHPGIVVADLVAWLSPALRLAQHPDRDKPVITLTSPEDREIVYDNTIFLEGRVTDASHITAFSIEGTSLWRRQSRQLFFAYVAPLRLQRENGFLLEAVDASGNRAEREIVVTHKVQRARQVGSRLQVVLTPFAKKCQPGRLAETADDRLFSALIARKRFNMRRGENLEGAEGIVRGTVCEDDRPEAPKSLEVFARFFDVGDQGSEEAQIEENVYGEDLTMPGDVQTLMAGLALKLQRHFPLEEGYVTDKEGRRVWVNLSHRHGVRPRMKLIVFREEQKRSVRTRDRLHTLLAEARILDVFANDSVATLLRPQTSGEVRELDKVITK
jgi:hypothetical protein